MNAVKMGMMLAKARCSKYKWEVKWLQWLQERIHALGITKYTATMEESLNARDRQRVHFHLKANFKDREWPSCQFGMIRDDVFFLANA